MFRAAYRLSSGALTVFAASGLHRHVVTGRSQVRVGTQWDVNQRLQIQLEPLMMSGICSAFNERWINPLNAELNPICYLLALLAHHFLHVSRIRVKSLTLRLLMSYIYIY